MELPGRLRRGAVRTGQDRLLGTLIKLDTLLYRLPAHVPSRSRHQFVSTPLGGPSEHPIDGPADTMEDNGTIRRADSIASRTPDGLLD